MGVTKRSNLIDVAVLTDAIQAEFAGAVALFGSPAVVQKNTLPSNTTDGGRLRRGSTVQVPYFNDLGEMDDINNEDDSAVPVPLTMTDETATVEHAAKAVEISEFAQLINSGDDPYQEVARQFRIIAQRKWDKKLIDKAGSSLPSTNIKDVWNATNPVYLNWDVMVDAQTLWGDEQDGIVMLSVHSKVLADLKKLKDSTGRPMLEFPPNGRPVFLGMPVVTSDRNTVVPGSGSTPAKYKSYIYKRGALALWLNGAPRVLDDTDTLKDTDILAMHCYYVVHRYKRTPGATKPGVIEIVTNASS